MSTPDCESENGKDAKTSDLVEGLTAPSFAELDALLDQRVTVSLETLPEQAQNNLVAPKEDEDNQSLDDELEQLAASENALRQELESVHKSGPKVRFKTKPSSQQRIETEELAKDQLSMSRTQQNEDANGESEGANGGLKPTFDTNSAKPSMSESIITRGKSNFYYLLDEKKKSFWRRAARKTREICNLDSPKRRFYLIFFILPTLITLWYGAAILFPTSWHDACPVLVWTPSAQSRNSEGEFTICPRPSICSEGTFQVFLISVARLTAFASYVVQGLVWMSKMHSTIHYLSSTYVATLIPVSSLHEVHTFTGSTYFGLALVHTLAHLIRWGVRSELGTWCGSAVGLSGILAMVAIAGVVLVMSPLGKKIKWRGKALTFENRFTSHWAFFWGLTLALCFHVKRTRVITLIYFSLWLADYLYGVLFRTHRLDVVEFSPLPENGGTQMLWKNPPGFSSRSGEFVRIRVPWLNHGGPEWHPFSIYLREATAQGLEEVHHQHGRIFVGEASKGGRHLELSKTALLLIEFQNEFCHPDGGLYEGVKDVLKHTNAIANVVSLVQAARTAGVPIIHAPITVKKDGSDNPNSGIGILKVVRNCQYFLEGSWNAQFVDELRPELGDKVVEGKHGLDSFPGSNLEEILLELGTNTLIIGGLLTNCCVESTMRTAYEKGLNTITLVDGTACNSRAEQLAAVNTTYKMFSTPLTCLEVEKLFKGTSDMATVGYGLSRNMKSLESGLLTMEPDVEEGSAGFDGETLEAEKSLEEFCTEVLSSPYNNDDDVGTAARQGLNQHDTTQVFVMPAGDWTQCLSKEVQRRQQMRSCWVRGPYTSPYHVTSQLSHSVLMASGIGITPALGVIGQHPGASKTKILNEFVYM